MILIIFPAILPVDVCIRLFISDLLLIRSLIFLAAKFWRECRARCDCVNELEN